MLLLLFFFFSFLSLLTIARPANAQVQTARYGVSMTSDTHGFYEYLPQGYDQGSRRYPLLLFFHGAGERGSGNVKDLPKVLRNGPPKLINEGKFPTSFTVNGETFRFIVLSPQMVDAAEVWNTDSIINYAIKHYRVDENRIYLTGLSMGGGTVWYYGGTDVKYGDRIAAAVPVCGACWPANDRCQNIADENLPVWATHNSGDGTVPVQYTIDFVNNINKIAGKPLAKMTIFDAGGHDAWSKTYDPNFKENGLNVYEWMLTHTRDFVTPVTGLSFQAALQNQKVTLQWRTETEPNNAGFVIEKSLNGNDFDSISYVSSKGNGGGYYTYADQIPAHGKNYYRLKQIDKDGKYSLSKVETITNDHNNFFKLYPNPVDQVLHLDAGIELSNARIRIFDASGKVLIRKTISGGGSVPLHVHQLPAGIYTLEVMQDGKLVGQGSFLKK